MDENELKRLIWRSRRGLLELDLQLQHFVRETVPTLSCDDQVLFRDVLLLSDRQTLLSSFSSLLFRSSAAHIFLKLIIGLILSYIINFN